MAYHDQIVRFIKRAIGVPPSLAMSAAKKHLPKMNLLISHFIAKFDCPKSNDSVRKRTADRSEGAKFLETDLVLRNNSCLY